MSDWVKKTHRWVNKDAKPIALVRENGSQYYLDYVFDISDTNSFGKCEIKLWKYENAVIQTVTTARNENIQTNETAVEYDEGTYIGNKNSKKLHRPDCHTLPAEKNRVEFTSRADAINAGYSPCGNCQP